MKSDLPTIIIESHDTTFDIMVKAQKALLKVDKGVAKLWWKVAKANQKKHGYLGVLDIVADFVDVITICPLSGKQYFLHC